MDTFDINDEEFFGALSPFCEDKDLLGQIVAMDAPSLADALLGVIWDSKDANPCDDDYFVSAETLDFAFDDNFNEFSATGSNAISGSMTLKNAFRPDIMAHPLFSRFLSVHGSSFCYPFGLGSPHTNYY